MRQAVTFRLDPVLLAAARECAVAENRSLTNFVETLFKRHIAAKPAPAPRNARRAPLRSQEVRTGD